MFADLAVLLIKFAKSPIEEVGIQAIKDLSFLINKNTQNKDKTPETPTAHPPAAVLDGKLYCGVSDSKYYLYLLYLK